MAPELDFFVCTEAPPAPFAFAFVFDQFDAEDRGQCNILSIIGVETFFASIPLPRAWACINDIAALCRSLR